MLTQKMNWLTKSQIQLVGVSSRLTINQMHPFTYRFHVMNFTKDQLLALMNTIDFATDNDASYEEYTILQSGTADLEPIRDILYNEYRS